MHRIEGDNVIVEDGKNQFTETSPATIITAKIMNAIQEEICKVIEDAGISVKTADGDTFDQLSQAIGLRSTEYDYIVTNQNQLNTIIERVAANQYKIVDDYHSIYVKYVLGGYACSGGTSFLSGGDTWGYIETNDCANLVFEAGTYLGFGANPGYIEVNTDDCYLKNVSVRGSGSVGAITQSFLLNAHRVKFDHCNTNTRNSSVDFVGFQGSATAAHNYTSSYNGCSVYTIDGTDKIYGFKDCYNLNGCNIYDIDANGDNIYGCYQCYLINSCIVSDLDADSETAIGYYQCCEIGTIFAVDIYSNSGIAAGFVGCEQLCSCIAETIDANSGDAIGFSECHQLSSCKANDIDSVSGNAYGFDTCNYGAAIYTTETCTGCTFINADTNEYSCPTGLTP